MMRTLFMALWLTMASAMFVPDENFSQERVPVHFETPHSNSNTMGVFWLQGAQGHFTDKLQTVLPPGSTDSFQAVQGHAFAVRSGDHKFRAEVSFGKSKVDKELKHAKSGYLWLEPG